MQFISVDIIEMIDCHYFWITYKSIDVDGRLQVKCTNPD